MRTDYPDHSNFVLGLGDINNYLKKRVVIIGISQATVFECDCNCGVHIRNHD